MTGNNDFNNQKPNYNDTQYNKDFYSTSGQSYQQSDYVPQSYGMSSRYDDLYDYEEESGSGSFLAGALVGVVIGAAAALFLAPKSGKEFRGDLNTQVSSLKEKSQSSKSESDSEGGFKQQLKDQSSKVVDKVKGVKGGSSPMDDGTASSEGEESIDMHATIENTVHESNKETETAGNEAYTSTANALKEAVEEVNDESKSGSGYSTGSTTKDDVKHNTGSNKNSNAGDSFNKKKSGNPSNKNTSGSNNPNKNNSNSNSNKNNSTK
ncbi:YtxH domain-containing protein [Metaplanococcus flavidus]|uniref:YtxH domain-containing protein n=1 Tax=Metaplanococcus flavidus TaxID=569883 RepID=A0ABW3LAZ6_9BACL